MLVLSRKKNQSITLEMPNGEIVTVNFVNVDGHRARVGIDAPKDVKILRSELKNKGLQFKPMKGAVA